MKIEITAGGIYGANGEIPVGTVLDVKEEPKGWAGRYRVVSGGKGKTAVTGDKASADGAAKAEAEAKEKAEAEAKAKAEADKAKG